MAGCGIKHCEGITGAGGVLEVYWRRVFLVFVLKLTTEGADGDSDTDCGAVFEH